MKKLFIVASLLWPIQSHPMESQLLDNSVEFYDDLLNEEYSTEVEARIANKKNIDALIKDTHYSPLLWACRFDHRFHFTQQLLELNANPNHQVLGDTPLLIAASYLSQKNVEELLKQNNININPQFRYTSNVTPLHAACLSSVTVKEEAIKQEAIVKALLDHGANPNLRNRSEHTPLYEMICLRFRDHCDIPAKLEAFVAQRKKIIALIAPKTDLALKYKSGKTLFEDAYAINDPLCVEFAEFAKQAAEPKNKIS